AYDALVHANGEISEDLVKSIEASYQKGVTDEFLDPIISANLKDNPDAFIKNGDAVICFNFRTDRCREITEVLSQRAIPEQDMQPLELHYTTMTEYDATYKNVHVIFENDNLVQTLGEVLSSHGKTQLRMAETEKYPHVTFFFSGGRESLFPGEDRKMAASPKVATYDLQPEMSAIELTDYLVAALDEAKNDFICINYANADMVGHTGVFEAVVKAVETVDQCVQRAVTKALEKGYIVLLTADHGNADYMINEDGSPNTQHSLNPVPVFLIGAGAEKNIRSGKLGDIAPTILHLMQLPIPKEMTGELLVN
ncbi:MAG: 2,3-bisphosphoglycerate-independent phosphoglycerate mutase, partial [Sediminibacterium sp.]|nr:2,3-bisphosphoglycerate-independent phosphoglycerate mutase [Sediminibacterium sp.]